METSLKTGFAQIFSCCPKNLSCPNFGGAAAPLAPPARTPMSVRYLFYQPMDEKMKTWTLCFPAKESLMWRRHCSVDQSCCGMTSKRSIG